MKPAWCLRYFARCFGVRTILLSILLAISNDSFSQNNFSLMGTSGGGGSHGTGSIFTLNPDGSDFKSYSGKIANPDGGSPDMGPVKGADGFFYGVAKIGGVFNDGIIYRINDDGSNFTRIFEFDHTTTGIIPRGRLLYGSDNFLYGVATFVEPITDFPVIEYNVIYKVRPDGSGFTTIYRFVAPDKGWIYDGLIECRDGALYGMTWGFGLNDLGFVFKIRKDGTGYQKLFDFDSSTGGNPQGTLLQADNLDLYGTTVAGGSNGAGTIFRMKTDGTGFTKLREFGDINISPVDGFFPISTLMQASNGDLYGMNSSAGNSFEGTIFRINLDGSQFTKLHDFANDAVAGRYPNGTLTELPDGTLIGCTRSGGVSNEGTLFKIKLDGTGFNKLIDFNRANGSYPYEGVAKNSTGDVLGVTTQGGLSGFGVIYKFDKDNSFSIVKHFLRENAVLYRSIKGSSSGELYGIAGGGINTNGSVFKISSDGSSLSKAFDFDINSYPPSGDILLAQDGNFYGIKGTGTNGSVFKFSPGTTSEVHVSDISVSPTGSITQSPSGDLFFSTISKIFKIHTDGSGLSLLTTLNDSPAMGWMLSSGVMIASDGNIYGVTDEGGVNNSGAIFKVKQDGTGFTKLYDFVSGGGSKMKSTLVEGSDGYLYGTAFYAGMKEKGILYKINKDGVFSTLIEFDGSGKGAYPYGGVVFAPDGYLYGNTGIAGLFGAGTVYKVKTDGSGFVTLVNFKQSEGIMAEGKLLIIPKADQTITFDAVGAKLLGDPAFDLSATAGSQLAVQYSTTSDKVTILGRKVTVIKPGSVTIKADQSGNNGFNPAPTTSQTFCINPLKPTITARGLTSSSPVLTSSSASGNQWYNNEQLITGATSANFNVTQPGIYTVKTSVDNCVSEVSAPQTVIITGDLKPLQASGINIYPNPASETLIIKINDFNDSEISTIKILDLTGHVVDNLTITGGKAELQLSSYAYGMYIVKAIQADKIHRATFIKK